MRSLIKGILGFLAFAVVIFILHGSIPKYNAWKSSNSQSRSNYIVSTWIGNQALLETQPKYPDSPNDVKVGMFNGDYTLFAAAYHYSGNGGYTWIGIWSLPEGKLVASKEVQGYWTDIEAALKLNS